jgi:hypothetical protein
VVAAATAMVIPRVGGEHAAHLDSLDELGAAAPLAEPGYAGKV